MHTIKSCGEVNVSTGLVPGILTWEYLKILWEELKDWSQGTEHREGRQGEKHIRDGTLVTEDHLRGG